MRKLLAAFALLASTVCALAGFNGDGFGSSGFFQYLSIVTPSGAMITPVFLSGGIPGSGTGSFYGPPASSALLSVFNASATVRFVPIPIAGTIGNLAGSLTSVNTSASIRTQLGATPTPGTVQCSFNPSNFCFDNTHTDHLNAGTLLELELLSGGGTWAGGTFSISFAFTGDNTQQSFMLSGPSSTGFAGTVPAAYAGFGAASAGGITVAQTEVNVSSIMPAAASITGLYVYPNGTETSVLHTYTLYHNGTASGTLLCTPAAGTGGCCVNTDASPGTMNGSTACTTAAGFSVVAGDTLSVQVACPTAPTTPCANVFPGVGVRYTPTIANQAFITAQDTASPGVRWIGLEDNGVISAQTNYQIAPASMTLLDLISCTGANPLSGSWNIASQLATTSSTAPTTAAGPALTINSTAVCPTTVAGLPSGGQDTSHSFSVLQGYSLDTAMTSTGSPTGSAIWKFSMVGTIP